MRFVWALFLLAAWIGVGNSQEISAKPRPTLVIHGPTVVAFFAPITEKELENNSDENEALGDFQFYNSNAKSTLHNAGIEFLEADYVSFRIRIGKTVRTYRTDKMGVGYIFISPGKAPRIESGVMTDEDLLQVARKYFGVPIR